MNDDNKSNGFDSFAQQYKAEAVEQLIDVDSGAVVDQKELRPFDIIKALAKQTGLKIRDPKRGCKKCGGEGYVGRDAVTKSPIPCHCIYIPLTDTEKENERLFSQHEPKMNRQRVRNIFNSLGRSQKKAIKKQNEMVFITSADKSIRNKRKRIRKKK